METEKIQFKEEELIEIEKREAEGIDPEEVESEFEIESDPFDPDEISINTKPMPMETCLRRLMQGTINLNPDFQRKEVWTPEKKSQLIESLMLKIPLPMFYVSSDEKGNFTVVDGLQRLSTIRDFVLGEEYLKTNPRNESIRGHGFRLNKMEFWTEFNGKNFVELPIHLQNRILETVFSFTIINPGTPEEVKRNIFKRINTGGLPLSTQEIRNALYLGKSTDLLRKLAQSEEFKQATAWSVRSQRMEDQELVLRFLAFLVRDFTTYERTIGIDRFLSETMVIINSSPEFRSRDFKKMVDRKHINPDHISLEHIMRAEELFKIGMSRALEIHGRHCFRKSYGNRRRSPINKSLFEMWGVCLALLSSGQFEVLNNNKKRLLDAYHPLLDQYDFQISISRDSMKAASVKERFGIIKKLIHLYS